MSITIERLLQTEQFKRYMDLLPNPNAFLQKLDWAATECKVSQLEGAFPKDITVDQLVSSVLLNLQLDYDSMITNLPMGFTAKQSKLYIHACNTNQIGIYYGDEIRNNTELDNRIACVSLHFRDMDYTRYMYIENVQGELKERKCPRRDVRKIFGKLNSHFGEDWRVGLVRQLVQYAHDQGMEVRGQVPGVFSLLRNSLPEYPLYSLNYVRTYLRSGIPIENIEFKFVSEEVQPRWDAARDFLKTKNPEERLHLLDLASKEYTESYRQLRHQWLEERIDGPTYDTSCKREFGTVFEKYLA